MKPTAIKPTHQEVTEANVAVHSTAAATYDLDEPHFRPESRLRVRQNLERMFPSGGGRMLDVGCGTGFLSFVADGLFDTICGIDATPAMVQVARARPMKSKATFLITDVLEFVPDGAPFDLVAGYAFLHHLVDPMPVLRKAWDWLAPRGQMYFDLEPNLKFWSALESVSFSDRENSSAALRRELASNRGDAEAERYGIDEGVFALAEYGKKVAGGFDLDAARDVLIGLGAVDFQPLFHWFVGEAFLIGKMATIEGSESELRSSIDAVLQDALPLSSAMFKYVGFTCRKPGGAQG